MRYELVISRKVLKDVSELPRPVVGRVTKAIDGPQTEPRPSGCTKLKGKREVLWRIRIGQYRLVYGIADEIRIVQVRDVGHRSSIYG